MQDTSRVQPSLRIEPAIHAQWYAAYTSPRHEKSIAKQLEERQIDCFLPVYRSVRRWKDRRKEVEFVLFPGYIFVSIRLADRLKVLQLPGVVRFVSFHGLPAPLPENEIEALRNGMQNHMRFKSHPYLKVGRRVQVKNGPMAGAQGIFIRRKQGCRLVISLDAIMRSVALEVGEEDVEPIS
ncbi:MAG TPA: UpxY family transcription antiterminator [Terriglobales bacterium]|nr:UpxY family transcription antiterminator [Terriglobales bacterium]